MKKLLIFIMFLISFCIYPCYAESDTELLSKIENNLYGFDYSSDTQQNRVNRLEKTVYGNISKGDTTKRIKKLAKDVSADVIGLEIEPTEDTFLAEEYEKEDNTVNYPIVDEIEQKIFNKTFRNRDFHTRIVTIEKKLFGKIYDVEDYSSRMDRIKSKVMPENLAKKDYEIFDDNSYKYSDNEIISDDLSGTRFSRYQMPFGQRKYTRPYSNYGDFAARPTDNFSDNTHLNNDLSQMEYNIFGTEFSNESYQKRIKRLNSVNKAKKSAKKYDSQKFAQHMSTAMEIGAMILMILAMVL